jgi:hypothetical protein
VSARDDVKDRIDKIEESYEFFLAYAAQGLTVAQAAKSSLQIRDFLGQMEGALDGLANAFGAVAEGDSQAPAGAWDDLVAVLASDAKASLAAIRLVLSRPGISSQIIDNLNANIHLRAVLTDLFLMDDLIDQI